MASKKPKAPKRKKPQDHSPSKPLSRHSIKKKKPKKSKNPNHIPLGKNKTLAEKMKNRAEEKKKSGEAGSDTVLLSTAPAAEQLRFFLNLFQSANKIKLSPLELEAFKDTSMVRLAEDMDQDVENLSKHMKAIFGTLWKEVLCEGNLSEGTIDAGSPAVLIISTSALRSLELLRGLKPLTRECRPAKLFAKHLKVEEQVGLLKSRVNFASGTPSRIKKLIDMDALSLSRLAVVVLDMHRDVKGYSLLTLPQVSAEFWDLYRSHLLQRLLQGDTRICLYGVIPSGQIKKVVKDNE
ncbi:protein CMSS1 [Phoenix dactylifera]|uniref:Protein CMSS1 n=1 Tax=Phoenix dactylifera TaxID=42345 RepID=A0A8B7BHP2_PHODC|nr:protein CMSS1 [Phoenix dactylifera]